MKQLLVHIVAIIITLTATGLVAQDWPIFKGNIYFTGNNDEVIVKNNNLKWLYQADERVFNPVVSDGRVFFSDIKSNVYCLDEEYGKVQWRVDFKQISSQFKALSRSAGKIKYPLVKDNMLFLSDPIAMYAFDKHSGRVLWARTGMRTETA
ncbi:MAG TPA: PQQ-binding-like beta-propeller repeat protein, partial [Spirochaetota bacterium]|nr:PQQ-binding-like beta-propeller repeat protein [Spirochaetota bacterium]